MTDANDDGKFFAITGFSLTAVHVNAWVDWVFVHVHTNHPTGLAGLGELSVGGLAADRSGQCALTCLAAIEQALVGKDGREVVKLTGPLLALATHLMQQDVPGVTFKFFVGKGHTLNSLFGA